MDNNSFDAKLAIIAADLEHLERRFVEAHRLDAGRITDLEIKVQGLENRLKDLDSIEHIAIAAYAKMHPEAEKGLREIDDAFDAVASRIALMSLPTMKDQQGDTNQ